MSQNYIQVNGNTSGKGRSGVVKKLETGIERKRKKKKETKEGKKSWQRRGKWEKMKTVKALSNYPRCPQILTYLNILYNIDRVFSLREELSLTLSKVLGMQPLPHILASVTWPAPAGPPSSEYWSSPLLLRTSHLEKEITACLIQCFSDQTTQTRCFKM